MFPWLITVYTDFTPDQVCLKLAELTDTKVNAFFGMWKALKNPTRTKAFGGKINFEKHTFKLFLSPHSFWTYFEYITIYQGRTESSAGKYFIKIWVRPSARGFFLLLMFICVNFLIVFVIIEQGWDAEWGKIVAIFSFLWAFTIFQTTVAVKEARKVFQEYFPNKTRPLML